MALKDPSSICKVTIQCAFDDAGFSYVFYRQMLISDEGPSITLAKALTKTFASGAYVVDIIHNNQGTKKTAWHINKTFQGPGPDVLNYQGERPERTLMCRIEAGAYLRRPLQIRAVPDAWIVRANGELQPPPATATTAIDNLRAILTGATTGKLQGPPWLIHGKLKNPADNPLYPITNMYPHPTLQNTLQFECPGLVLAGDTLGRVARCSEFLYANGTQALSRAMVAGVPLVGVFTFPVKKTRQTKPYRGRGYVQLPVYDYVEITDVRFQRYSIRATGYPKNQPKGRKSVVKTY